MARLIDATSVLERVLSQHSITQADFARLADVTVVTVNRWARGRQLADTRKLAHAIRELGDDPATYGIPGVRKSPQEQLLEELSSMREDQRRQHEETLAALSDLRIAIDVLRARS